MLGDKVLALQATRIWVQAVYVWCNTAKVGESQDIQLPLPVSSTRVTHTHLSISPDTNECERILMVLMREDMSLDLASLNSK